MRSCENEKLRKCEMVNAYLFFAQLLIFSLFINNPFTIISQQKQF